MPEKGPRLHLHLPDLEMAEEVVAVAAVAAPAVQTGAVVPEDPALHRVRRPALLRALRPGRRPALAEAAGDLPEAQDRLRSLEWASGR